MYSVTSAGAAYSNAREQAVNLFFGDLVVHGCGKVFREKGLNNSNRNLWVQQANG